MAKRPRKPSGETPDAARTDSNVTRIPQGGRAPAKGVDIPPADPVDTTDDDLTADALRQALDRGEGGDKTDFIDPAAAPLGTDDEAAGFPPTREERQMAARAELGHHRPPEARRTRRTIPLRIKPNTGVAMLSAVLALLLIVVLVALL